MNDDDLDDLQPRSAGEIAERVLGLIAVIGKVQFPSQNAKWMAAHDIARYLSQAEREFIDTPSPAQRDMVNFSWRSEALVSLLWSLHGLERMPELHKQFDVFSNAMVLQAIQQTPHFLQQPVGARWPSCRPRSSTSTTSTGVCVTVTWAFTKMSRVRMIRTLTA